MTLEKKVEKCYKIIFRNCFVINNVYDVISELIEYIIIGLTETWTTTNSDQQTQVCPEYERFFSPAVKTHNKGRASGVGVIVLIKRVKN